MKLSIQGTEYDYARALQKAKLLDQADLFTAAGIGIRSIRAMLFKLDEAETVGEAEKISEHSDVLIATQGLVFLCKRYAGEKVSFEDTAVAWDDLEWIVEESDLVDEPDPTQASAVEPARGGSNGSKSNGSTTSSKKSKTSKPASTAASS